ncbi:hypothetical protein [uncultured Methanobrevibacter sp.]|nr:hypothetical protein [uncultured Methanobrevibacter sp.]
MTQLRDALTAEVSLKPTGRSLMTNQNSSEKEINENTTQGGPSSW